MEEIEFLLEAAKEQMTKSLEHTIYEFTKIRAGKASPEIVHGVMVEYYGAPTPIQQVAAINTSDARTIVIKPFEKTITNDIERAIINSDLGLNPQNDGELIRLSIPALTEERRKDLVKQARNEAENGRVSIRNARKEGNDELKKLLKDGASEDAVKGAEQEIQDLTNNYIKQLEDKLTKKEADIMTV